jgi:Fe-S-cluster-containing dehydrogenase component
MSRYAMVIDQRKCIGCMACIAACRTENNLPPGHYRTKVVEIVDGEFPNLRMELRSELCNHCDNPPCAYNCPTGASYKAANGTVQIKRNKCVGCKACVAACPYNARYIDPAGFADKCTFCEHRIKQGKEPACVATCIGRSRIFGDLDDPNMEVSRLIKDMSATVLLREAGTEPKVFYIRKLGKAE